MKDRTMKDRTMKDRTMKDRTIHDEAAEDEAVEDEAVATESTDPASPESRAVLWQDLFDYRLDELPVGAEESQGMQGLVVGEDIAQGAKRKPASETALLLDEWGLRRGREVLEESERLRAAFGLPGEKASKKGGKGKKSKASTDSETDDPVSRETIQVARSRAEKLAADFHGAAFEPEPELASECQNERLSRYMKQLFDTPEFQQLHRETQLDEMAAEIATVHFAEQWVALEQQDEPESEFDKDRQCLAAAGKAMIGAKPDVSDYRDARDALDMGGNGAEGSQKIPPKQLSEMYKRVRGSRTLKRISELAGRYRRFAQAMQRKKVLHGRDDVVGVVLDGDIGRLLPQELVCLDDPMLELDVLRRIAENEAMCRDHRGVEQQARGPIVVVVDESGSMSGDPVCTAKAMALALAWVAKHQNRWYCLVGFSGGAHGSYCVAPPKGKPRYKDFERDPKGQSPWAEGESSLMDWLEHFYSGGTTMDVPLVELPNKWDLLGCPKGKTDIICITDAQLELPNKIRDNFLSWKEQEKVRLITLVLGYAPGDMSQVSDRLHCVNSLSMEETAVAEALSI